MPVGGYAAAAGPTVTVNVPSSPLARVTGPSMPTVAATWATVSAPVTLPGANPRNTVLSGGSTWPPRYSTRIVFVPAGSGTPAGWSSATVASPAVAGASPMRTSGPDDGTR